MKKVSLIFMLLLAVTPLLAGCQQQKPKEETVKLVWQIDEDFTGRFKSRPEYFNQVLKEKNLPYEIEFISRNEDPGNRTVDIKTRASSWTTTYDTDKEILAGEILPLDGYLESKEGRKLKNMLPEKVWDAYKVNGKNYYLLSVPMVPFKIVYIWDKEVAKKYDVHPENWNEKVWEYKEDLQKVWEGEKERENFLAIEGLTEYSEILPGLTQVFGFYNPLVIHESDPDSGISLLYETPEYQEYLRGVQTLYQTGAYEPEKENALFGKSDPFLRIETMFETKETYTTWRGEDFWETHEMKEIWTRPLWRLTVAARETGVSSESEHPDDAFSFLYHLYTNPDLTNALQWGEEGVNYKLVGKTAEDPNPVLEGYVPSCVGANDLISYAEFGAQSEDKAELYPKWLEECEDSCLKGFHFSAKECEEEVKSVFDIYNQWIHGTSGLGDKVALLEENDAMIQEYKDAGVNKVIEEWNRQYREFRKKNGNE